MPESERNSQSIFSLKGQARALVAQSRSSGGSLTHSLALETVARKHGYADWNAAKAATISEKTRGPRMSPEVGELDIPDDLEWVQLHDRLGKSIQAIVRLASELETIADSARDGTHTKLLTLVRGHRPYLFESNPGRWNDARFHLVDRSYSEIDGFILGAEELQDLGFEEWGNSDYCTGVGRDAYPVMDDRFMMAADRAGLKRLARLLIALAKHAYDSRESTPAASDSNIGLFDDDD